MDGVKTACLHFTLKGDFCFGIKNIGALTFRQTWGGSVTATFPSKNSHGTVKQWWTFHLASKYLGGGNSNIFYFHPYLGKIPILTNIFQMGWNHQPDMLARFLSICEVTIPKWIPGSLSHIASGNKIRDGPPNRELRYIVWECLRYTRLRYMCIYTVFFVLWDRIPVCLKMKIPVLSIADDSPTFTLYI